MVVAEAPRTRNDREREIAPRPKPENVSEEEAFVAFEDRLESVDAAGRQIAEKIEGDSPEDKEAAAELALVQKEVKGIFARAVEAVAVVAGMPAEFIKKYFEAKRDKELQVVDNPKVIKHLQGEMKQIQDRYIESGKGKQGEKLYKRGYSDSEFQKIETLFAEFLQASKKDQKNWSALGGDFILAMNVQIEKILSGIKDGEDSPEINLSNDDKLNKATEVWRMSFGVDEKKIDYVSNQSRDTVGRELLLKVEHKFDKLWSAKVEGLKNEGKTDEELRGQYIKERDLFLLKYPEVAAKYFLTTRDRTSLTSEKQHELLGMLIENEAGPSFIAEFNLKGNNLRPEKLSSPERALLFGAYLEKSPDKICFNSDVFWDELNAFSEEQIINLIDDLSAKKPYQFLGGLVNLLSTVHLSVESFGALQEKYPQIGKAEELVGINILFAVRNSEICGIKGADEKTFETYFEKNAKQLSEYDTITLFCEMLKHVDSYDAEFIYKGLNERLINSVARTVESNYEKSSDKLAIFGLIIKSGLFSEHLDKFKNLFLSNEFSFNETSDLAKKSSQSKQTGQNFNELDHSQMLAVEFIYGLDLGKQNTSDIEITLKNAYLENVKSASAFKELFQSVSLDDRQKLVEKFVSHAESIDLADVMSSDFFSSCSIQEKNIFASKMIEFGNGVAFKLFKADSAFVMENFGDEFLSSITEFSVAVDVFDSNLLTSDQISSLLENTLSTIRGDEPWKLRYILNKDISASFNEEIKNKLIKKLLDISAGDIGSISKLHGDLIIKNFMPDIMAFMGVKSMLELLSRTDTRYYINQNLVLTECASNINNAVELSELFKVVFPDKTLSPFELSDNNKVFLVQKVLDFGCSFFNTTPELVPQIFQYATEEQKGAIIKDVLENSSVDEIVDFVFQRGPSNDSIGTYLQENEKVRLQLDDKLFTGNLSEKLVERLLDLNYFSSYSGKIQQKCLDCVLNTKNTDLIIKTYWEWESGSSQGLKKFPELGRQLVDQVCVVARQQRKSILSENTIFYQMTRKQKEVQCAIAMESGDLEGLFKVVDVYSRTFQTEVPDNVMAYVAENLDAERSVRLINSANDVESSNNYGGYVLSPENIRSLTKKILSEGNVPSLMNFYDIQREKIFDIDKKTLSQKILDNADIIQTVSIMNSDTFSALFTDKEKLNLVTKHLSNDPTHYRVGELLKSIADKTLMDRATQIEFAKPFIRSLFAKTDHVSQENLTEMSKLYQQTVYSEFVLVLNDTVNPDDKDSLIKRAIKFGIISIDKLQELIAADNPFFGELSVSFPDILRNTKEIQPENFWKYFEFIQRPEVPARDFQLFVSFMVSNMMQKGEYSVFDQYDEHESGEPSLGEEIKEFNESHSISDKGLTIVTLLAAREAGTNKDPKEFTAVFKGELLKYKEVLDLVDAESIPDGAHASIGMEYEVSKSIANEGYLQSTGSEDYKEHILRISEYAKVGQGRDAVHEVATRPTDNPYAMLLEMQLLQDLEFFDFNFEKAGFEKGGRGYHLTIGGERGLTVNGSVNMLQNLLVMTNWGGVNAGKNVDVLTSARNSNIRQRSESDSIKVFENASRSVEFRSLSLDKKESFERCVMTSYYGSVAIQSFEKYFSDVYLDEDFLGQIVNDDVMDNAANLFAFLDKKFPSEQSRKPSKKEKEIIFQWLLLAAKTTEIIQDHNQNFYDNEAVGYSDNEGRWVDTEAFNGQQNSSRFDSVVAGENITLEQYLERTHINPSNIFNSASVDFVNGLTAINNLFLKPSREIGGDKANALALLETTKFGNGELEEVRGRGLRTSLVDTRGKGREGYYSLQGGSERMVIHATQIALLEFNKQMEKLLIKDKKKKTAIADEK